MLKTLGTYVLMEKRTHVTTSMVSHSWTMHSSHTQLPQNLVNVVELWDDCERSQLKTHKGKLL